MRAIEILWPGARLTASPFVIIVYIHLYEVTRTAVPSYDDVVYYCCISSLAQVTSVEHDIIT